MALIPWRNKRLQRASPPAESHPVAAFRREMDRLLESFWRNPFAPSGPAAGGHGWAPTVDIAENEEEVVVRGTPRHDP